MRCFGVWAQPVSAVIDLTNIEPPTKATSGRVMYLFALEAGGSTFILAMLPSLQVLMVKAAPSVTFAGRSVRCVFCLGVCFPAIFQVCHLAARSFSHDMRDHASVV